MITMGKVSSSASPAKAQAARNLPVTASKRVMGRVISSSMEPDLRSSAQSRMAMAGTRKR
ncbi:hypothetical protein D3C86_2001210 [compost metagenome]